MAGNGSYTDRFRTDLPDFTPSVAGPVHSSSGGDRSRLIRLIERACNPVNTEPNLAINLEIADIINSKKGNAPREAAITIVKLINSRVQSTAILALALLDICVKNCGYPFHLQISRKEFLNELVRKFPERPPMRPTRIQMLILEAIEEWNETICQTSKYKDDLGYIRDMHRLLSFKGYVFPEINKDDQAVLNIADQLKSVEELAEEERAVQSAKLQELIRRGTPADLQEANRLMKIMAGFDQSNRTDFRAKAAEEIENVRRKAYLLDEMMSNLKPGEELKETDVFEELSGSLKTAQPKLQKMASDESTDEKAVSLLLKLNDQIHSILERYDALRNGGSISNNPSKIEQPIDSLIDLDGSDEPISTPQEPAAAAAGQTSSSSSQVSNLLDLEEINFDNHGNGGAIALSLGPSEPATVGQSSPVPQPPQQSDQSSSVANLANAMHNLRTTSSPSPQLDDKNSSTVVISATVLGISIRVPPRQPGATSVDAVVSFSNQSPSKPIDEIVFQVAVPKSLHLHLGPQSGQRLENGKKNGIWQKVHIDGVVPGSSIKLRWRVTYKYGAAPIEEDGEVSLPEY